MSTPMFSRASFLRRTLGLTTAAVGGIVLAPRLAHAAPVAAEPIRTTATTRDTYTLVLDGQVVGTVGDVRGGNAYIEMVPDASGVAQLGGIRYRSLDMAINLSLGQPFYERISSSWSGKGQPLNGSIFRTSVGGPILERQFTDAVIVGTTFPTLNLRSDEPARMTVSLLPGASSVRTTREVPVQRTTVTPTRWHASNFTLDIDGLDTPGPNGSTNLFSRAVVGIDSFTVGLPVPTNNPIVRSSPIRRSPAPRAVEFPTFAVTLQRRYAEPLSQWFDALVLKSDAKAGAVKPTGRNGVLSWLAEDLKTVLARLRLTDVGICELSDGPFDGADNDDLVTAVLYCQRMELDVPKPPKA